jgi:hypothetical protein
LQKRLVVNPYFILILYRRNEAFGWFFETSKRPEHCMATRPGPHYEKIPQNPGYLPDGPGREGGLFHSSKTMQKWELLNRRGSTGLHEKNTGRADIMPQTKYILSGGPYV